MAYAKPTQLTSWSYSRWSDYEKCPLFAKLKHIDKIQEPPNAPMARGAEIGKAAEDYIKGKTKVLREELKSFKKEFEGFRKLYAKLNAKIPLTFGPPLVPKVVNGKRGLYPMTVEDTWAFTKTWTQTTWNDWVNCWVRIKLDCAHEVKGGTLIVTDFKTGKFRAEKNESYMQQLELYALGALLRHPLIREVRPRLMYTDQAIIYPDGQNAPEVVFTQDDVPKLKALWDKRTRKMLLDKSFVAKPNDQCRWCWYRSDNTKARGGKQLCKF